MVLGYELLWKAIIRPPRASYEKDDLGPNKFIVQGLDGASFKVERSDFTLVNSRGNDIVCSHFEPFEEDRQYDQMPCVVYMHGNSSCRLEALDCVTALLPLNITLFCFDFSGCGLSEGEYISLGWWEREDLATIIAHLRAERRVSSVALWGRSMGAVTALLHADRDPSIAGLVLDSPFSNLPKLANELAFSYMKIPNLLVNPFLKMVAMSIRNKANFDIYDLSPIDHVSKIFIPGLFATAKGDDFVAPHHTHLLHDSYTGEKNLVEFEGDHNSQRPEFFYASAANFLVESLKCEDVLNFPGNKFTRIQILKRKEEIKKKKRELRKLEEAKKRENDQHKMTTELLDRQERTARKMKPEQLKKEPAPAREGPPKPLSRINMSSSMAPQPKDQNQDEDEVQIEFSDDDEEEKEEEEMKLTLRLSEYKMRSPSEILKTPTYEELFGMEDNFEIPSGKEELDLDKPIPINLDDMSEDEQLRFAIRLSQREAAPTIKMSHDKPRLPFLNQPFCQKPPAPKVATKQQEEKKDEDDDYLLEAMPSSRLASPLLEKNLLDLDDKSIPQEEPSPEREAGGIRNKNDNISEFLTKPSPLTATKSVTQVVDHVDFGNFKIDDPRTPKKK